MTVDDMEHLCRIVEEKDGGPAWFQVMDRSAPNMSYQAWRRDPEVDPCVLSINSIGPLLF